MLDETEPLTGRLINAVRSDLLLERGVPRMVECNVESALGGVLDADGVIKRWMDVYADEPMFTAMGAAAPPSAVDARYDAIRADVGPGKVTGMLFTCGRSRIVVASWASTWSCIRSSGSSRTSRGG